MRHFYLVFLTPSGPGAMFCAIKHHPLHPETHKDLTIKISRGSSLQGPLVQPNQVIFTSIFELEDEVVYALQPPQAPDEPTG